MEMYDLSVPIFKKKLSILFCNFKKKLTSRLVIARLKSEDYTLRSINF